LHCLTDYYVTLSILFFLFALKVLQTITAIIHQPCLFYPYEIKHVTEIITIMTTATTILWPLYRTTCASRHPQLRCGGLWWSSFTACMPLLMATSASTLVEDTAVLPSGVTCTVSIIVFRTTQVLPTIQTAAKISLQVLSNTDTKLTVT